MGYPTPSPLLFLLQTHKRTVQVLAVFCVLGEEEGRQDRREAGGLCLPAPVTHPQSLLLQLGGPVQQLLLQL